MNARGGTDIWGLVLTPAMVSVLVLVVVTLGILMKIRGLGADTAFELKTAAVDGALLIDSLYALPADMNVRLDYAQVRGVEWEFSPNKVVAFTGNPNAGQSFLFATDSRYSFSGGRIRDVWAVYREGNEVRVEGLRPVKWDVPFCGGERVSLSGARVFGGEGMDVFVQTLEGVGLSGSGSGWVAVLPSDVAGLVRVRVNLDEASARAGCRVVQAFAKVNQRAVMVPVDPFFEGNVLKSMPTTGVALAVEVPPGVSPRVLGEVFGALAEGVSA